MKKQRLTSNGQAGTVGSVNSAGHTSADGAAGAACCGCGAAGGVEAASDGVGPGAHAAGVDAGLKAANLKHLKRIEGQVRGIAAMIEEDRYCADIIQQCAAVQESLRAVAKNLLRNHLGHCASRAMHGDKEQQTAMVEELIELVGRIAR
ncbi:MAG: metal-sensitive transcriptional regulator [Phycisphaeraceae bacterium]|nr:metal-sensitive transcriptional regulator [Phycisphaerales bacterium]QOJ16351.1 MAG: metal-sensitive transcriptional regulator [Phycisphaeraceae bacterium]